MQTTNSVMQLHNRLKFSDEPSESRNNNMMLKELENAVIMTQNMLTKTIRCVPFLFVTPIIKFFFIKHSLYGCFCYQDEYLITRN